MSKNNAQLSVADHLAVFAVSADHLPVFALLNHALPKSEDKTNSRQLWQKIDDTKKDGFLLSLESNCSKIDLDNEPENILQSLTDATKCSVDTCFPPKPLSNKAKKRAEQPWIDKEIAKQEKEQAKLFRKFTASKNPKDQKNYNSFRRKLTKKKKKTKKSVFQRANKGGQCQERLQTNLASNK